MNENPFRTWIGRLLTSGVPTNQTGSFQNEAFVRSILKEAKQKRYTLESEIKQIPITILDTETTGFHPEAGDQIISIAIAKTINGKVVDDYYTYVNPQRAIPYHISELTQIKEEHVQHAPALSEIMDQTLSLLSGSIITGYHIQHDLSFLNHYLWGHGRLKLTQQSLELRQIMESLNKQTFKTLDDALQFYNISCQERHTAKGDVNAMVHLWKGLLETLAAKHIHTLSDLYGHLNVRR
ncbi:hypothetical protein GCM10011391_24550 [Pullulanibacillus camelliae]|uniref:Exonuclease domain-containing protein n=1 Tax=Pullulanibacillus camelliae TaxID=1707096 RepID=A0A8J2YI94_9BACL|nr:exonuclease domain-containing protein [Pullulanibacillus camelliae]GGE44816.1 hypothetical protein GCM10011391_24550 [Pullulanibacillus camelliae]